MKHTVLLGFPLGHSITPLIYAATFTAMGIDACCEARPTPPEGLAAAVARLRDPDCLGANVTIPHKEAVLALIDEVDPAALEIGAVNCIANRGGLLTGYNTDRYGFLRSLQEAGFKAGGCRAVLLGAGGAARAVAVAMRDAGAVSVVIAARSAEKAALVARSLSSERLAFLPLGFPDAAFGACCREADVIVNCTPLGTKGSPGERQSPLPAGLIRRGAWAFDLVYNPPLTPFLKQAREADAIAISGLDMLVYQGAESIRLWTGNEPPTEIMRSAAKRAVEDKG